MQVHHGASAELRRATEFAAAMSTNLPSKLGAEEEELIELLDQIGMVTVTLQYWAECRVPVSDVASVNASGEFAIVLRKGSRSCSEKVLK